jgi:hypothetical protein
MGREVRQVPLMSAQRNTGGHQMRSIARTARKNVQRRVHHCTAANGMRRVSTLSSKITVYTHYGGAQRGKGLSGRQMSRPATATYCFFNSCTGLWRAVLKVTAVRSRSHLGLCISRRWTSSLAPATADLLRGMPRGHQLGVMYHPCTAADDAGAELPWTAPLGPMTSTEFSPERGDEHSVHMEYCGVYANWCSIRTHIKLICLPAE